jgi:pilus assembly protein CpaE
MSKNGKAVAILGSKGGVGTTTTAVNLAATLAHEQQQKVLVIDLNLFLGDVGLHLGLEKEPTVMQFLNGTADTETIRTITSHRTGFSVLGLASDLSDADDVSAERVVLLMDQMRQHFDVVVIDCGTDLNEVSLTACRYADARIIVMTEQRPALLGAKRRLGVLQKLDIPGQTALGVINRAHPESGIAPAQVESAVGMPIIARIRNAWQENQAALAAQRLLIEHCPGAGVTRDFTQIVRHMRY